VDVPPLVSTAPQPVSTAPIFADPAPAAGPGTSSVFPPTPLAQSPAARVDSLNSPPAAPARPIPSANQATAPRADAHTGCADDAGTEKDPHGLDTDGSAERGRLGGEPAAERACTAYSSTPRRQTV
jgi:hypothetical protein